MSGAGTSTAGGTVTFVDVAVVAKQTGQRRYEVVSRGLGVEKVAEGHVLGLSFGEVSKIDVLLIELVDSLLQEPLPNLRNVEISPKLYRGHCMLGVLDQELPGLLLLTLELVVQGLILLDNVGIICLQGRKSR